MAKLAARSLKSSPKQTQGQFNTPRSTPTVQAADSVLALQQAIGNRAVSEQLQANQVNQSVAIDPVLNDVGKPLDLTTRAAMESRFGQDLSQVRVHTSSQAATSAQALHAQAYTVGQHIVFGAGQYAPESSAGKRLLAHELTHTLQQRSPASVNQSATSEQEADRAADAVMSGSAIAVQTATPIGIARQPASGGFDLTETASPMMARAIGSVTIDNFALGKADIPPGRDAELRKTARQIVTLLKRYPRSTIRVTGHTDMVGTPERNETLGSDRANAVKAVLVSEGVPEEKIQAQSKGETAPAVSTKDEKPEPCNRRVEVQFDPAQSMLPSMVPDLTLKPKPPAPPPFDPFQKQPIDISPKLPIPGDRKPGPWRDPQQPLPPWFWKPNPFPEIKGTEPKTPLDVFYETLVDPVLKPLVSPLPKEVQKFLIDRAHDAIEAGLKDRFESAVGGLNLDDKTKEVLKQSVETLIKSKPGQTTDRKSETEGSPYRKDPPPSRVDELEEQGKAIDSLLKDKDKKK
ncbi:DUF4157 domain-containing protein [Microcoleus sp. FACHB-1515]|uniref:eCIS core domain-containing protein n=1 Tax=Cyanophyceae TaxID=3028117 RepID=UPI0016821E27|nr:DUF4157 domain-containing protein [Microcoleus sp. FACHB-1515]MBD2089948.1 DUF4157 domain-containing protein [Microcoleus sp. FACHB-1515]